MNWVLLRCVSLQISCPSCTSASLLLTEKILLYSKISFLVQLTGLDVLLLFLLPDILDRRWRLLIHHILLLRIHSYMIYLVLILRIALRLVFLQSIWANAVFLKSFNEKSRRFLLMCLIYLWSQRDIICWDLIKVHIVCLPITWRSFVLNSWLMLI